MARFGKYAADGSVEIEADVCILTERHLTAPFENTIRQRVAGTPWFYRIVGGQYDRVTPGMLALWDAEAKAQDDPIEAKAQDKPATVSVSRSGKTKSEGGE